MKRFSFLLIAPALLMTACGTDVKKTLGLERSAPDEFAVIERAPLVVPPNFDLMPPTPGALRPQETTTTAAAKDLMLGSQSSAPKPVTGSVAEQSLLQKAGVSQNNPNIRTELNTPDAEDKKTAAQRFGLSNGNRSDKMLDPVEEAKKLKSQNVKTVPVTEAKKPGDAK